MKPLRQNTLFALNDYAHKKFGEWLRRCNARGVAILIYETYRSPERQDTLYAQGRTSEGPIVTNARAGESKHQDRVAIDSVPWEQAIMEGGDIKSKLDWTPFHKKSDEAEFRKTKDRWLLTRPWRVMAEEADKLKIKWAGDWDNFVEYVHFEVEED
mgnify:CR=1 FL=1